MMLVQLRPEDMVLGTLLHKNTIARCAKSNLIAEFKQNEQIKKNEMIVVESKFERLYKRVETIEETKLRDISPIHTIRRKREINMTY
jgi:hypothetical protein